MIYTQYADLPAQAKNDYLAYMMNGIEQGIRNVHAHVEVLELNGRFIPYSIKEQQPNDSWIHSLTGQYIDEMVAETERMNLKLQPLVNSLLSAGRRLLKLTGDRTVTIYPSFMSTTLYHSNDFEDIEEVTAILCRRFPKHAIVIRTVHEAHLIEQLQAGGYDAVVSRAVYLFDAGESHSKNERKDLKKDIKRFNNSAFNLTHTIEPHEFSELLPLYEQVYLEKYSMYNPHYTAEFFQLIYNVLPLKWFIVRDDHRIISFMAVLEKEGVLFPAYFGMDQSVKGLYFMTSGLLYRYALDNGLKINNSAGAKDYKLARGSRPVLEFHLLYIQHLPLVPRLSYQLFIRAANLLGIKALKTIQFK